MASHHSVVDPELLYSMKPGLEEEVFLDDLLPCASVYQDSACITFINILLSKASHLSKPEIKMGTTQEHEYQEVWLIGRARSAKSGQDFID